RARMARPEFLRGLHRAADHPQRVRLRLRAPGALPAARSLALHGDPPRGRRRLRLPRRAARGPPRPRPGALARRPRAHTAHAVANDGVAPAGLTAEERPTILGRVRVLFYYRGIENLGIGYLMSMLKHHGHEIDLIFDPGLDDNLFLKAPHLAWLNRHEALLERAVAFNPDLITMGSLTNLWPFASKMAEKLKQRLGKPIIVGGHHAQALANYILKNPHVDMACIGEGEIALLELVTRMERGADYTDIPGIWVKKDGVVHRNDMGELENDLDRFPFPEKQLWWEYGCFRDNLEIFTGRGCPFKCTFCNIHYQREIFAGKGDFLRKRSIPNVIAEFKQNLARYDVKFVSIHDDNFTTNPH